MIIEPYKIGFVYLLQAYDRYGRLKWQEKLYNLIPTAGLNYIVSAAMAGGSQYSTWYIGLSETAYAPVAGETMTTIMTNAPECTAYSGGARKTLTPGAVAAGLYSNTASPAAFVFTSGATIRVGFVSTVATHSSTSGLLISAVQASSPKVMATGETLNVTAGIQLTAA